MKKNVLSLLLCLGAIAILNTNSTAQSTLIHYWHFNNYAYPAMYTPTITAIAADFTDLPGTNPRISYQEQTGTSIHSDSTYLDDYTTVTGDYDTVNARMGVIASFALRTRNPSDSMELLFYTPSTHFNNLVFTFACEKSTNGMSHQNYDYSIDGGTTWDTTGLSMKNDTTMLVFKRYTLTCTNTAVNNNPNLVFRIRWNYPTNSFPSDTGTAGNNRFDNVTLDGDTITTTGINNQLAVAIPVSYTLYPDPVVSNLNITSDLDGVKSIVILNAAGQTVYMGLEQGKHLSINAVNLCKGNYYIRIRESATGEINTLKFTKL